MPSFPVRDLVSNGGSNADQSPNALPPNVWSNAVNARVTRKRMERFGGTQIFAQNPGTPELLDARFGEFITRQGAEGILIATATACYFTLNGTAYVDITPAAGWADTDTWNLTQYGDVIILTSLDTEPFVLLQGAVQLVPFTNWPANYQVQKIVPYKNILVGLGVEISNNAQSGLVIWSDIVSPANVVGVNWDPADATSLAGENTLPDKDGEIRDGGVLRDSLIVYTDSSVWRMDLTNATVGVTPQVFNFRKIFSDDGILKNRCFVEVDGAHYVVGRFDIYRNDGFNKPSISDNRFTEFFYGRIGTGGVVFVSLYERPQEIVISYGVDTDSAAREALVYNFFYDTWTRWSFGSSGFYTHFFQGPDFGINVQTWADLQTAGTLWSDLNSTTWNDLFPQSRDRVPYILGNNSTLYRTDVGGATSSVTPAGLLLERIDLDLDEAFGGTRPIKHISKFIPLLQGEGDVRIQFGGRDALNTPVVWQPERTYTIGSDYKFDLRISHRYPAIRLQQDPDEGTLALDGFDLIVHAESQR